MIIIDNGEPDSTDSLGITVWDNCGALLYHTLVHYALRTIPELRHHRNRIATGRAAKGPARTRAGIKYPFLLPVDREPESGNIPRDTGIGHNLEMDRGGWYLLAVDRDGAGRGLRSGWRHKIR